MPLYEYECEACRHRFEKIQRFSDPLVQVCPSCGKGPVNKLLSAPAIQFKGTGWYVTDYAGKKPDSSSSSDSGSDSKSDNKSDSTSDSKSDSTSDSKSDTKSDPSSRSSTTSTTSTQSGSSTSTTPSSSSSSDKK